MEKYLSEIPFNTFNGVSDLTQNQQEIFKTYALYNDFRNRIHISTLTHILTFCLDIVDPKNLSKSSYTPLNHNSSIIHYNTNIGWFKTLPCINPVTKRKLSYEPYLNKEGIEAFVKPAWDFVKWTETNTIGFPIRGAEFETFDHFKQAYLRELEEPYYIGDNYKSSSLTGTIIKVTGNKTKTLSVTTSLGVSKVKVKV